MIKKMDIDTFNKMFDVNLPKDATLFMGWTSMDFGESLRVMYPEMEYSTRFDYALAAHLTIIDLLKKE